MQQLKSSENCITDGEYYLCVCGGGGGAGGGGFNLTSALELLTF